MRIRIVLMLAILFSMSLQAEHIAKIGAPEKASFDDPAGETLRNYATAYFTDRTKLAATVMADLRSARPHLPSLPKDGYVSVVFGARPPTKSDPEVIRFFIHTTAGRDELVDHLVGTRIFYEAFLSNDPQAKIETIGSAKPLPNPLETDIVKFAKLASGSAASLAQIQFRINEIRASGIQPETTPSPAEVFITLREITIDTDRAAVTLNTRLISSIATLRDGLMGDIDDTERELLRGTARISPCAQTMATALAELARKRVKRVEPNGEIFFHAADRTALIDEMAGKDGEIARVLKYPPCDTEAGTDQNDAVMDVESAFLNLVAGGAKPISGSTEVSFSPLERWTLGVAGGAMFRQRGAVRAKLNDDGKIIADRPSGLLSMAALHWHPIAFDSAAESPSVGERVSVIAGVVVSPEPGLAGGLSWLIFRGFSFTVSQAWLRVKTPTADHPFGSTPGADVDPFRDSWTRTVAIGFGYKFD